MMQVEDALRDTRTQKNVSVLLYTSDFCRSLVGVHAICCKSGKDRTGMAVTLEEARFLCYNYGALGGCSLCQLLRKHGGRRKNVWANTGKPFYAFNGLQTSMIPACYRAPNGTFSGAIQT
jgi:hypothetical protein